MHRIIIRLLVVVGCLPAASILAQDDVPEVPSKERRAGGDEQKRYFLIGPKVGAKAPKAGFKLLVVMPGGGGGAEFQPFVKHIFTNALSADWLVVQPVAVQWDPEQAKSLVWPTQAAPWKKMKFSTEEFIEAVIADAGKQHKIDPPHVYTLSWSSSGPAAYAIALQEKTAVRGSFVAMSVFQPAKLPLARAQGRAFYLYQSRDDKVCKFSFAERARKVLAENGANVTLVEYAGGDGWHGDVFADIRRGVTWLQENSGKSAPKAATQGAKTTRTKPGSGDKGAGSSKRDPDGSHVTNLLPNGGFEDGLDGWTMANNSGRATFTIDPKTKAEGRQALRIDKTGGVPMDVLRGDLGSLPKGARLKVSARVRTRGVKNAFFKYFVYDEAEQPIIEDVDIAHITGTSDWKKLEKTFEVPDRAKSAAVMFVMVLDGSVWLDDVRVEKVEE
jgi:predicted esterase